MSYHSTRISKMGSSFRSDLDLDDFDKASSYLSSQPVTDRLVLLSPKDKVFDNVSECSDDLSMISHPFSENTPRDGESKHHSRFSTVHDETMKELKEETQERFSICSSCETCSTCSTDTWEGLGIDESKINVKPQQLPPELEKIIRGKINQFSIVKEKRQKERAGSIDKDSTKAVHIERKPKKKKEEEFDAMSGLWNMLATYDEFVVTPPGFNAFQQEKPHWLDQEPIPWAERERARKKCVKWLSKYHK